MTNVTSSILGVCLLFVVGCQSSEVAICYSDGDNAPPRTICVEKPGGYVLEWQSTATTPAGPVDSDTPIKLQTCDSVGFAVDSRGLVAVAGEYRTHLSPGKYQWRQVPPPLAPASMEVVAQGAQGVLQIALLPVEIPLLMFAVLLGYHGC